MKKITTRAQRMADFAPGRPIDLRVSIGASRVRYQCPPCGLYVKTPPPGALGVTCSCCGILYTVHAIEVSTDTISAFVPDRAPDGERSRAVLAAHAAAASAASAASAQVTS